jgi:hypothetical protein
MIVPTKMVFLSALQALMILFHQEPAAIAAG